MPDLVNDVMVVWELRGDYPDIPTFPDVDISALTKGDEEPFFVTLPIGEANVTSRQKRHYDEAFVTELAKQTAARKPVGMMGHISPENIKNMDFPDEVVHWVGAKLEGNKLWGKAYVVPGPGRERVRRYKATNRPMATSIYAHMGLDWDKSLGAYRAKADTLDLHQIDLGPVDRAGIPSLSSVPIVTSEMIDSDEETTHMDKLQIIREMSVEDADLIPKPVREAILTSVQQPPEVALVAELRDELGDGDILATVREWKTEQNKRKETAVTDRITELVNDEEKGVKVETVRPIVMELVKARRPETVEEADEAYSKVVASEPVMEMLKAAVVSKGGPPLRTGLQSQNGGNKYFNIPKKEGD